MIRKNTSKLMTFILILSSFFLIGASTSFAEGPGFGKVDKAHHFGKFRRHRARRFRHKRKRKFMKRKFRKLAKLQAKFRVSLKDSQKAKLKALRLKRKQASSSLRMQLILKRALFKQAILGDQLSLQDLLAKKKAVNDLHLKLKKIRIAHRLEVKKVFTPEQKKTLKTLHRAKRHLKGMFKMRMFRRYKRAKRKRRAYFMKLKASGAFAKRKKKGFWNTLSPAKQNLFRKLTLQAKRKMVVLGAKRRVEAIKLRKLFRTPAPNLAAIYKQLDNVSAASWDIQKVRLAKVVTFHNALSADEKVKHSLVMMRRWKRKARKYRRMRRIRKRLARAIRGRAFRMQKKMNQNNPTTKSL